MARGPETKLKDRLLKSLKEIPNTWWVKFHGGPLQTRGIPDILGCAGGCFIGIELKCGVAVPTPLQRKQLELIEGADGYAFVVSCGPKGERSANEDELIEVVKGLSGKKEEI